MTEIAVRKLIANLFDAGYIGKKGEGRGMRYRINPDLPMRHDSHREIAVGSFLESLGWKNPVKRFKKKT